MSSLRIVHFQVMATVICLFLSAAKADKDYIDFVPRRPSLDNTTIIVVDCSGGGNFTTLQAAIDSVPNNNSEWIQIIVKAGFYSEKIRIVKQKQFIYLKGEGIDRTVIQWGDAGSVSDSPTFTLFADNFFASDIMIENTYNGSHITWAPAAKIQADKAAFYRCGFVSIQDTLWDAKGRHYYDSCYIEGTIDFIWGQGQSLFQDCIIYVSAARLGDYSRGYITAQGRVDPSDTSAFVFKNCTITGTGKSYLGRAYRNYSRVIFYQTFMEDVIVPEGWSAWHYAGQESTITYSEVNCTGPGSDMSKRVNWMTNLMSSDLYQFIDGSSFNDRDRWMDSYPYNQTISPTG